MTKIAIILGSTRPNRFGPQVANWMMELTKKYTKDTQFELIDLAEINLPFMDEPKSPLYGDYKNQHTKDWAKLVDETDGFIFVTPEYNHSTSAVLKNALDFAFREWHYKPVAFVSYGADAGGARATEHLRAITGYLRMYDLGHFINLVNYWDQVNEKGEFQPTEQQTEAGQKLLAQLVFWTQQMKQARPNVPA